MFKKSKFVLLLIMFTILAVPLAVYSANTSLGDSTQTSKENDKEEPAAQKTIKSKVVKELKEKRTSNTKHFLLEDGTYEALISSTDLHYKDINGEWQENDTAIIDEELANQQLKTISADAEKHKSNKKGFKVMQLPFTVHIAKKFEEGFSVSKENKSLTFIPINVSKKSKIAKSSRDNIVTFKNAWDHVDVELEILSNGIKETLFLNNSKAPLTYSYQIIGDIDEEQFANAEMTLESPFLIDANGVYRDIKQEIVNQNGKKILTFTIDSSGLAYPIIVDPTVSIQPYNRYSGISEITIGSGGTVSKGFENYVGINGTPSATPYNSVYRTLYKFDLSSFNGVNVLSAELELKRKPALYYSRALAISRITTDWSFNTVNWSNQPSYNGYYFSYSLTPDPRNSSDRYNVTNDVHDMVNGGNNYGWTLFQRNEASDRLDHRITYVGSGAPDPTEAPKLIVSYTGITTPKIITPNPKKFVTGLTTISWTPSVDSNNPQTNLKYHIELRRSTLDWKKIGVSAPGVTSFTYDFTNEPEGSAQIRISAQSGTEYSKWSAIQGFTISPIKYYYNGSGQLTSAVISPIESLDYKYDANGNLISKSLKVR